MISVIICSKDPGLLAQVSTNIADTIGTEYELIPVDNSAGKYSIFQAYNLGMERSSGNILCFMHEDMLMFTTGWGRVVNTILAENSDIGMIGLAGGQAQPFAPSSWSSATAHCGENRTVNVLDNPPASVTGPDGKPVFEPVPADSESLRFTEVKSVDGMFMCIRRSLFDQKLVRFDEETFAGFHAYDKDICMQVALYGRIVVPHNLKARHLSSGNYSAAYFEAMFRCFEKWRKHLPVSVYPLPDPDLYNQAMACRFFSWMTAGAQTEEARSMARKYFYDYLDGARRTKFFYRSVYSVKYKNKYARELLCLLSRAGIPLCSKL